MSSSTSTTSLHSSLSTNTAKSSKNVSLPIQDIHLTESVWKPLIIPSNSKGFVAIEQIQNKLNLIAPELYAVDSKMKPNNYLMVDDPTEQGFTSLKNRKNLLLRSRSKQLDIICKALQSAIRDTIRVNEFNYNIEKYKHKLKRKQLMVDIEEKDRYDSKRKKRKGRQSYVKIDFEDDTIPMEE